jgi:hypothetical protein
MLFGKNPYEVMIQEITTYCLNEVRTTVVVFPKRSILVTIQASQNIPRYLVANNVYVIWADDTNGNNNNKHVYLETSNDNGNSFGNDIKLSNSSSSSNSFNSDMSLVRTYTQFGWRSHPLAILLGISDDNANSADGGC